MTEIDYALTWDFIDPADGKPRQLRFRRNFAPHNDPRGSSTEPDNSSPSSETATATTTAMKSP